MNNFADEWTFYLEVFRLHQGLTRESNFETRALLKQSIKVAISNDRNLPRAHGLWSFTILNAWLSDWIDQSEAKELLSETIQSLVDAELIDGSFSQTFQELNQLLGGEQQLDIIIRKIICARAAIAVAQDASDYENHWSLATANLYDRNFPDAFAGYTMAQGLANKPDLPGVGMSSLSVDLADARFFAGDESFAGNESIDDSAQKYIAAIQNAIVLTETAIAQNPTDPKRFRWNWTLGWAYYELGGYIDPEKNYPRSLTILRQLRNPHHLIRKNLIASYVAVGLIEPALQLATEFICDNPKYKLAVENRWPYRSTAQLERWKNHLRIGGLPE